MGGMKYFNRVQNIPYNVTKTSGRVHCMDRKTIVARIDQLIKEKQITPYQIQNNADISSTIYQWRKNPKRDVNRKPCGKRTAGYYFLYKEFIFKCLCLWNV